MDYRTFVQRVQEVGEIEAPEEAERAIVATLETLGERLEGTHRSHVATQLPGELRPHLEKRPYWGVFLLPEFYNRVAARADVGRPHAERRSQAVMAVLREAIAEGEWRDMSNALSADYGELLDPPRVPPTAPLPRP
jgi:uncharacterized protein (DUF2267 family)